jgi:molybdenum cofactor cytidylyltransferase
MIAAIVLAAGMSSRFGKPKLLLPLDGRSLIRRTVEQVITAGSGEWEEVVVVVGYEAARVQQELEGLPIRTIVNPRFASGMSASLITGLQGISSHAEGAMIFLGDQPLVSPEVVRRMLTVFRGSQRSIVVPVYDGVRRNPVLFSRSLFPELMTVKGDKGGRDVVMRHPESVASVAFPSDVAPRDVDTWEDYEALRAMVEWERVICDRGAE